MKVRAAGKTDADAIEGLFLVRSDELADAGNDGIERLACIGGKHNDILGNDLSAEIGDSNGGLRRMDVECDDGTLIVELDECGTAATGKSASGALQYPMVSDKLFDDERDGAALETGEPREIGPGDGRAGANEIEEQVPVDLTRSLIGGGLFAGKDKVLHS